MERWLVGWLCAVRLRLRAAATCCCLPRHPPPLLLPTACRMARLSASAPALPYAASRTTNARLTRCDKPPGACMAPLAHLLPHACGLLERCRPVVPSQLLTSCPPPCLPAHRPAEGLPSVRPRHQPLHFHHVPGRDLLPKIRRGAQALLCILSSSHCAVSVCKSASLQERQRCTVVGSVVQFSATAWHPALLHPFPAYPTARPLCADGRGGLHHQLRDRQVRRRHPLRNRPPDRQPGMRAGSISSPAGRNWRPVRPALPSSANRTTPSAVQLPHSFAHPQRYYPQSTPLSAHLPICTVPHPSPCLQPLCDVHPF